MSGYHEGEFDESRSDETNVNTDDFQHSPEQEIDYSRRHNNVPKNDQAMENKYNRNFRQKYPEGYSTNKSRLNVLFMMVDDMRTQLEMYEGDGYLFEGIHMHTPHLKSLASKSLLLKNAFVQYSLCGPSRSSMLTSRRPDTLGVYGNKDYWRTTGGNYTTMPQFFKQNGYKTICVGKIFHPRKSSNSNDPISWTEPCVWTKNTDMLHMGEKYFRRGVWMAVTDHAMKDMPLFDTASVQSVEDILDDLSDENQPFFLALGFKKPHGPQVCPEIFFKHYPINESRYLSKEEEEAIGMDDDSYKINRNAYSACISYVDSLVGKVLRKLDSVGLSSNTIVSFMADHGFHWGEHGWTGKMSNFDIATKVPMMIHIPGVTDEGVVSESIVEALDVFPTIAELAGLGHIPKCRKSKELLCTEGKSLVPLLSNPNEEIHREAYSQRVSRHGMYYSVRTQEYRFVQIAPWDNDVNGYQLSRDWMELYDHRKDFKEYYNVAYDSSYTDIVHDFSEKLRVYIENNM